MKKFCSCFPVIIITIAMFASLVFTRGAQAISGDLIPNMGRVKAMIQEYRDSGEWTRELESAAARGVETIDKVYNKSLKQAVVFDIDETTIDNYEYYVKNNFMYSQDSWSVWVDSEAAPKLEPIYKLYDYALKKGLKVYFITGRHEKSRKTTEENLKKAGYVKFEALIMRNDKNAHDTASVYKAAERARLEKQGVQIIMSVGDQYSDLYGGHTKSILKLPNPMYYIP